MNLELDAITEGGLDRALAILARGFPHVGRERWVSGLAWLAGAPSLADVASGRILRADGNDVGVILTLGSRRDSGPAGVVNLSSWYVDPAFRLSAPFMLRKVTSARDLAYTSLTPSDSVERMLMALGFQRACAQRVLVPVALAACRPARAQVRPHGSAQDSLAAGLRRALDDHAAAGCLCAVLEDEDGLHPLVFFPRRRAGMRSALLAYAEDPARVLRHRGAVGRYLLRRGILALTVDHPAGALPSDVIRLSPPRRLIKGPRPAAAIDYLYSELPAFGV